MEKEPKLYHLDSPKNIEELDSTELAKFVVDSAAVLQNEDPSRFWGDQYGAEIDKTKAYIESIGLEEARKRFNEKKLNIGE